jgi:hypothetical protein
MGSVPANAESQNTRANSASASNQSLAIIPFELSDNLPYLQVRVNGSAPLRFILDSGAGVWVIDRSQAKTLGLKTEEQGKITGAGAGSVDVQYTKNVSFGLTGIETSVPNVALIDLSSLQASLGRKVDGIIGYDFFDRYVVEIDYDANIVRLFEPKTYNYSGNGEVIPITIKKKHAYVTAKMKLAGRESVPREYLVDSGSSDAVNDDLIAQSSAPKVEVVGGVGLGQEFKVILSRVERLQLGSIVFENTNGASGGQKIGGELLHRFTVIFDYSRQRMVLEPNRHFRDGFVFDMFGGDLRFEPESKGFRVSSVYKNSPASEAGVKESDLITTIDAQPVLSFSLDQVRRMFAQEKEYSLGIRRRSDMIRVNVKLRKLL